MENSIPLQEFIPKQDPIENISKTLTNIQEQLLKELYSKQQLIETKEKEITDLKSKLEDRIKHIENLNQKIIEVERNNEGNKQLNKKLINEIVRKQQDIEWYKRTYESRSLLGTLKEKIFRKIF
ncbi:hypothetical protein [Sabulibacter ruber]|uniref:hypothetical protein n=1 Tax=Sabulibacter ruber TaxID=2811901 RepID=UPI001A97B0D1|nr:hypothetical protein [Sabulibacter ruber]